jgi:hypothetical protein
MVYASIYRHDNAEFSKMKIPKLEDICTVLDIW